MSVSVSHLQSISVTVNHSFLFIFSDLLFIFSDLFLDKDPIFLNSIIYFLFYTTCFDHKALITCCLQLNDLGQSPHKPRLMTHDSQPPAHKPKVTTPGYRPTDITLAHDPGIQTTVDDPRLTIPG